VQIFKSRWFHRFAQKEGIADGDLHNRLARPFDRKQSQYALPIFFRRGTQAFFLYGFAKSQRKKIDADEEEQFMEAVKLVRALTDNQLAVLVKKRHFFEGKSE
jgi:hypothetical protein